MAELESRPRITIIDDNPEFLALMQDLLAPRHVVVTFSGHGITPDDIVDSRPDLLIVDLRLDDGDLQGHDIVGLTRGHRHLRTIPIVVCSADARSLNGYAASILEERNIALLTKPFTLEAVEAIVLNGLGNRFEAATVPMAAGATGGLAIIGNYGD